MPKVFAGLLVACALLTAGCDGGDETPSVDGSYSADFVYEFAPDDILMTTWTIELDEAADGSVTGTGRLGTASLKFSGQYDHPDLNLNVTTSRDEFSGNIEATVSDNGRRIDAVYNFSILYVDADVQFERQ
ncbi:MAG: hypothetical protein AAF752_17045 [Bacteroidota bacterium]